MRIPTQQRIDAQNQFNAAVNDTQRQLNDFLQSWIYRKVWTVSGHCGAAAKFAAVFDSLSDAFGWNQRGGLSVSLVCRHSWLYALVRGTFAGYDLSTDIDLGRVDDAGILSKLNDWKPRRIDYTIQWIRTALERMRELEAEAQQLRRDIQDAYKHCPFP